MRIIGGHLKGRKIVAPKGLPVRPTMDIAKEAIFNFLKHHIDLQGASVLDLFTGTGNMSYEFISRGADRVVSVDMNTRCISFVRQTAQNLDIDLEVIRRDVYKYIPKITDKFDLVFADPPYMDKNISQLPELVLPQQILNPGGLLIVEHGHDLTLPQNDSWLEVKKYGNSHFTIYKPE